jgi:hypothetical protein
LSSLQYYVYYKFEPARVAEVRSVVNALFDEVSKSTGIKGQWQRRRDDSSTFMETYSDVVKGEEFDRALEGAIEKSGFTKLGIARITEIFQCA